MKRSAVWTVVAVVVASLMIDCTNPSDGISAHPGGTSTPTPDIRQTESRHYLSILPIRGFQQTTAYTCGPASLVTLLRYYGREGDEQTIAEEVKCTPDKGTKPRDMVDWLEGHGFRVTWGEHGSLDLLRSNLDQGIPTLVEWIDYGGHWVLVVGYDTRGTDSPADDMIYFADPADAHDGVRDGLTVFNAHRFDAMWFDAFLFDRPMFKVYISAVPDEDSEGDR